MSILETVFKFSYKSKLETEERAKNLKSNIGNGLGRLFFQFLENVIKGLNILENVHITIYVLDKHSYRKGRAPSPP